MCVCDVYRAPGVAQAASWWSRHRAEYCSVVERPRYPDSLVVSTAAAHTQASQRSHQVVLQTSRLSQLVHGQFVVSALISPSAKPNVFVTRHCCTSNKEVMLLPWFVDLFVCLKRKTLPITLMIEVDVSRQQLLKQNL